MVEKHLSRLAAPKNWPIKRKSNKWVTRPSPGPHPLKRCISLNLLLKDILNYSKTTRESKKILNKKEVLVDKKVRKDYKFPLGVMDILEFSKTNQYFRVLFDKKGKFTLVPIKKEESNIKPCKILNKTPLKGKRLQLNLYDGKNILIEKDDYEVGGTVIIDLTNNKIKEHIKLEKGAYIYITDGKYTGKSGILKEILKSNSSKPDKIILNIEGKDVETLKDYAFVIGKTKSLIFLEK